MTDLILNQVLKNAEILEDSIPYTKAVIHGQWGVGKTRFCAGAPNPFWVDFERSSDTLRSMPEMSQTKIFRPKKWKEVLDIVKVATDIGETIVFDTATSMQTFYMREYMLDVAAQPNTKRDRFEIYQGDYKYATEELTDFFFALQELPMNVLLCAHSQEIKSKVSNQNDTPIVLAISPALTPKVWEHLAAFINVVGYLEKKSTGIGVNVTTKRRLYVNESGTIKAKNRLGIQDIYIEEPVYKEIFR
jgi:hypothetical protein